MKRKLGIAVAVLVAGAVLTGCSTSKWTGEPEAVTVPLKDGGTVQCVRIGERAIDCDWLGVTRGRK